MTTPTTPLTDAELNLLGCGAEDTHRNRAAIRAAVEIRALRAERENHRLWLTNATAQLDALRAERDDLLAVARMVAAQYEHEQHQLAAGHHLPADGSTWLTVDHTVGQAARAAIARAEGRAEG